MAIRKTKFRIHPNFQFQGETFRSQLPVFTHLPTAA
jgi:hypothetical protein